MVRTEQLTLIKELRERTKAPVTLCRQAIDQTGGDLERAVEYVQQHHRPVKPGEARVGKIAAYVHQDRIGVLIEVRCATDFVARTEEFQRLCKELTLQVAGDSDQDLLEQPYLREPARTIRELIESVSQQVGEPITVARVVRWEIG